MDQEPWNSRHFGFEHVYTEHKRVGAKPHSQATFNQHPQMIAVHMNLCVILILQSQFINTIADSVLSQIKTRLQQIATVQHLWLANGRAYWTRLPDKIPHVSSHSISAGKVTPAVFRVISSPDTTFLQLFNPLNCSLPYSVTSHRDLCDQPHKTVYRLWH